MGAPSRIDIGEIVMPHPKTKRVDTAETANDVSVWGEKGYTNADYTRPFMVDGEPVDLDALPKLASDDGPDIDIAATEAP